MAKAWWTYEPEDEAREREADHFGEWRDEQENPPAPWQPQTSDQQGPVVGPAAAERFRQAVRPQPAWRAAFRSPRTAPETPTLEPAPPIPYGLSQPPEITTGQRSPTVPGPAVQDLPMPPPAEARQPSSRPEPSPMDLALAGVPVRVPQPEPWRRAFSAVPGPHPLQMGPPPIEGGLPFGITREGAPEPAISPTRMATPAATATAPPGYVAPAGRGLNPQTAGFELAGRLPAEDTVEGRVLRAGIGDFAETAAAALERLGVAPVSREAIADWAVEQRQRYNPAQKGIENVEDFLDPRFWQTTVLRSVPMSLSLLPLAILGGTGGTAVASLLGAGWIGTLVLQAVGGGIVSGVAESLLEGGDAYKTARDKGLPQEEADKAFDSVFWKNTALLTGANGIEFALAFGKLPKPLRDTAGKVLANGLGRVGVGIARAIGSAGMEALEEGAQDIFQRQAEGEPIRWDTRLKTAMGAGAGMGAGFGAIGAAGRQIEEKGLPAPGLSVEDVTKRPRPEQQEMFPGGEDLPLLSGTPMRPTRSEGVFTEHEQPQQARMEGMGPDWDAIRRAQGIPTGGEAGLEPTGPVQLTGKQTTATGSNPAKPYQFQYRVMSLDDLIVSHDDQFAENPRYPRELQPRKRDSEQDRAQVQRIAGQMVVPGLIDDTGALDRGSPIIGPDRLVESGNGRTLGLRLARSSFPENWQAYQVALRQRAEEFGISPPTLSQIRDPILVRERTTELSPGERAEFVREANAPVAMGLSVSEKAVADANLLTDKMVDQLEIAVDASLVDALKTQQNQWIVDGWLMRLPGTERAKLKSGGLLTQEGLGRLRNAVFARTFPSEAGHRLVYQFYEAADPVLKNAQRAVEGALPALGQMESQIRSGQKEADYAIADDLAAAVDMLARLRQEGTPITTYLEQPQLFEKETTPFQDELIRLIDRYKRSPRPVRELFSRYAQRVVALEDVNQMGMPGLTPARPTKAEVLRDAATGLAEIEQVALAAESAGPAESAAGPGPTETADTAVRPAGERPAVPAAQAEAGVAPPAIPSEPAAPAAPPPTAARPALPTEGAPASAPPTEQGDVRRELADGLRDLADRLAGEPATARTTPEAAVVEEKPTEALVEPVAEKAEPTERAIEPNQEERFTQIEQTVREKPNISLSALLEARQSIADIQAAVKAGRLIEHPGVDSPTYSLPELPLTIEDLDAEAVPETDRDIASLFASFTLPKDLRGAKPRYGYRSRNFTVNFESQFDLAAYILAQEKRSTRDADYLRAVQTATGWDEPTARQYGRSVRGAIRDRARTAFTTDDPTTVLQVESMAGAPVPALGVGGATPTAPSPAPVPKPTTVPAPAPVPSPTPAVPAIPTIPAPPPNHVPTLPPVTPTVPTAPQVPVPPKPPTQPPLPVPPKPPAPQESDIPRLEDMQAARDAPPPTPALAEQLGKLWESYVRTFHSQTSPLKHWQRDAERLTGKKLSSKHQPYLYRRAQPGASAGAEKHMRFKLGPILRMVPEAAWHWWDDFLIKYDQVDKAAAVGRAVEKKIMADPVAETHKQVKRDETAWKAAKREARKADAQAKQTKDPADIASAQEKMANALALYEIYDQHKTLGDAVDAAQAALVAAQGAARAARTAAASARLAVYRARNDPAKLAQAQADYQQAMGLSQTAKAERTQKEQELEQAGRAMAKAVADVVLASRKWAWGTRPERLTASMDDLRRQIGDELFAQIEKASQQLWRYGHELLAMKRDAGLISQKTYDDWTQNFPHYMPIQIVAYLEQMDAGERPGVRSISTSDNDIHSLTEWGSEEAIRSPLKAYEDLTYRTYGLVYKNRASQAMALVAEEPGAESIIREAKEWTDERGRHHVEKPKHGEQLLSAFLEGQQHRYLIPQEYHDAIRTHNAELTKLGLVILRTLLRTPLQYGATVANIAFLPVNVLGDAYSFFVREGRMQDMVRHPLETTKEYARNLTGVFFDDAVMRELYEYGGGSSGAFFEGEPHGRQSLRDIARAHWYEVKDMRDVARLGKGLITLAPIRYLGSRAEMLPKRKAYRQRLAQGYSIEEAIVMAREANMDFAEGGSFTMFWNNFIPFFNVAWKAPYQLVTTFKNDPKGAIARLMVAVILPTVLAEIWNRADPDREKDYEDVWDYVKHSAIAVMAPWTGSFKDRLGKRIPEVFFVPTREFTPFVIATRQALKVFRGQYPDRWDKLVKGVMQSWSPVQTSGAAEMASTFMPPLLSSMVEIGTNRDFYRDRPLVPEELRHLPAGQQVQPWTTETAKLFSRTIGVPPAYVDHFVRANFAGVGQQALGATDLAIRGVREVTGQTVQKAAPAMEPGEEVWGWWVPKEGDARAVPGTDLPPLLAEAEGGKGALYVVYARSEADVKSRVYDQKYVGLVGTSAPFTRRREGAGFGEEVARATIGSLAGRFVRSGGGQRAEREREEADRALGPGTAAATRKAWALIRLELDQIAKEQRAWDDRLATKQIPGNEWRRETQRLGERRRGELRGISAALPAAALTGTKAEMYRQVRATLGGLLPDDRERAEYLSEVYLSMEPKPAPDGLPDMDEFFERRKAYMDALPQEEQQAVQAYLSRNASPIQKQYQRAQEVMAEYMAMPRWMGVTKERSDEMHQAEQQLRVARGKLPPAMENKTERALSLLALKDPKMAMLAREAHQRPRNQQRSLFRFRNADLLDRFYSEELRAEQVPEETEVLTGAGR